MSKRKGFRAFWKAEGELAKTALGVAGSLFRELFFEIETYYENLITSFKEKRNEKKNDSAVSGCRSSHNGSGADRL